MHFMWQETCSQIIRRPDVMTTEDCSGRMGRLNDSRRLGLGSRLAGGVMGGRYSETDSSTGPFLTGHSVLSHKFLVSLQMGNPMKATASDSVPASTSTPASGCEVRTEVVNLCESRPFTCGYDLSLPLFRSLRLSQRQVDLVRG